jgi:hypothetical protein
MTSDVVVQAAYHECQQNNTALPSPTPNIDQVEQEQLPATRSDRVSCSRLNRRVLVRGPTSIRDPIKSSGESSTGHRSSSLGELHVVGRLFESTGLVLCVVYRLVLPFMQSICRTGQFKSNGSFRSGHVSQCIV